MTDDATVERAIKEALGIPVPCSHPWRHTVYGSTDRKRNGTTCVICGAKL